MRGIMRRHGATVRRAAARGTTRRTAAHDRHSHGDVSPGAGYWALTNEFAKSVLEGRLLPLITEVLSREFGHPVGIAIAVASGGDQDGPPPAPQEPVQEPSPYGQHRREYDESYDRQQSDRPSHDDGPRMRRAYPDHPSGRPGADEWPPRPATATLP